MGLCLCWLVAGLLLALFGIPGRPWYLAPTVPPLLLLSAHAVHLLLEFGRRVPGPRPAFPLLVAVVWFVAMMVPAVASQRDMALRQYHWRFQDTYDPTDAVLIKRIETYTRPDDAIFLSAYRPGVYWQTGRRMACRYVGTINAGGWTTPNNRMLPNIASELRRIKPPLIHWMRNPNDGPQGAEFMKWIEANYRPIDPDEIAGLWLRSDRL